MGNYEDALREILLAKTSKELVNIVMSSPGVTEHLKAEYDDVILTKLAKEHVPAFRTELQALLSKYHFNINITGGCSCYETELVITTEKGHTVDNLF